MEDKTACRGRRVDVFGQRSEARAKGSDSLDDVEKVAKGPSKAVILGDHHHIAFAELVNHEIELRTLTLRSGDLISKNALGSCALKSVDLAFEFLVVCRDAGISDDHALM